MLSRLSIINPPTTYPVTTNIIRRHTRIDSFADDDLLEIYIASATSLAEAFLNRSLMTKNYLWNFADTFYPNSWYPLMSINPEIFVYPLDIEWTVRHMFDRDVELPRPPHQAVNAVSYETWDDAPDETPYTSGVDYHVDLAVEPGRVRLKNTVPCMSHHAALSINFTSGYGSDPDSVPINIRHALMLTVASMYERRGDTDGNMMPEAAEHLMWPYRMVTFA
jgi:hypothetical protein